MPSERRGFHLWQEPSFCLPMFCGAGDAIRLTAKNLEEYTIRVFLGGDESPRACVLLP